MSLISPPKRIPQAVTLKMKEKRNPLIPQPTKNPSKKKKKTNTKTNRAIKPILLLKNEFNSIRTRKTKKPT